MRTYKARGIVLHTIKYGDSSAIAYLFTDVLGRMSYMVQGIRSKRGRGNKAALLQPMFLVEFEGVEQPHAQMHRIREMRSLRPLMSVPFDVRKSTISMFMAEVLYRLIREVEANEPLFDFLCEAVLKLDAMREGIANYHLWFLVRLSAYLGFYPGNEYIENGCFDIRGGLFTPSMPAHRIGMNEACLNAKWLRRDLTHEEAQEFTKEVLNHMRERLSDYQEQYGDLYNLEATPAESTTYRLAKHDVAQFPDIITAAEKNGTPYYTNSSHLPVGYTDDVFEALDIQDGLQTLYTSGTVFHTFLGEKLSGWKSAASLVRKIAENYRLPYYTMSPTYSICRNHGYLSGEQFKCPYCGEEAEVYSRITGYYRPVKNWNDGKTQEFKERKVYDITNSHMRPRTQAAAEEAEKASVDDSETKTLLFTTKTCANCRIATNSLEKAHIPYELVDAEENMELAEKYGVMQAPTLVVVKDGQVTKLANASNIKNYAEKEG